jgi:hypothetical protein
MAKSVYRFRVAKILGKFRVCRFGECLGWVDAVDHEEALEVVCKLNGIPVPREFVAA